MAPVNRENSEKSHKLRIIPKISKNTKKSMTG